MKTRHPRQKNAQNEKPERNSKGFDMKKSKFWILLLAAILFGLALAFIIFKTVIITESYSIDMHVTIGNATGVNVATDAIYFGTIKPGNSVTKIITIQNSEQRHKVVIKTSAEFSEWIHYEPILFMEPKEKKEMQLTASIPKNAEYGTYHGKLKVNFYRW